MSGLSMIIDKILQGRHQNAMLQNQNQQNQQNQSLEDRVIAQALNRWRPPNELMQNNPNIAFNIPGAAPMQFEDQNTPENRSQNILANPNISLENKIGALRALNEQRQLTAQPKRDMTTLNFWDKSGVKRSVRIPADSYNNAVEKITQLGGTLESQKSEKDKNYGTLWAGKKDDPESWQEFEYEKGKLNQKKKEVTAQGFNVFRKSPPDGQKTDYLHDKAKLIDDTRSFYLAKAAAFRNSLTGAIDNPDGYMDIMNEMQEDLVRAATDKRPKWLEERQQPVVPAPTDALSNAAQAPMRSLSNATEQLNGALTALSDQFPNAKDETKKYLGQQGFIFKNGKWQVLNQ
jgi:hypothetical protein